jgi:hypothetical protein
MEIRLNHEQESEVFRMASMQDRAVEDVVVDLVIEGLRTEEFYRAKLERAIVQADRGEFIDDAEMDARVEAMLQRQ